jgi:L-threonylcarbamoyladenylate synthase
MAMQNEKYSFWHVPATIKKIVQLVRSDSVILSTTDTVLGLLAPMSRLGRAHLDTIKKRQTKPYIVLLPSTDFLAQLVDPIDNLHIENLIRTCWPGPLTLIFKARTSVPSFITGAAGTIAIRVPDHAGLRAVLAQCGPLFSTSANVADQPVPQVISQVDATILDAVAYIVDDKSTASANPIASTILDCSHGDIRVVRVGAYPLETLQKIAGVQFS